MTKKIKVLRIIARLNIGGPAIHTILLTEGLDKHRFETVLVTGTTEKDEGDMFYLAKEKGVRPVIIPELGRTLNIRNDIIAFWKLSSLVKRERPDIIHTHTAKAGALGRLAGLLYKFSSKLKAQSSKVRLVHTFHGHVLHSYFGRIKSALFIWIERFLAIFTDKIIAVSENLRRELIDLKIAGPKKIVTIPLGLELERYLKIENNGFGNRDCKLVGIIGRLVPIKNHRMFLDAAKRLKDSLGFGRLIKFLIVGDGPLRQELESYAEGLGISEDVTFTGWIRDLEKMYSELDIVVLTSLNEGTPLALIEAQAAARPCVATCVGGVTDVIEEGRSGFLVPARDIDKFTEALLKLLSNPDLALSMGRYGRERIKDEFSKTRLFRDIECIYEEIK
ncbi:MAG: glycosyltransferase family 4 protein [Candidatus Omnitrophica bacterium]|nr:glycosyltransferase family 4 protein [Candidatus Omnitrophota bacterium]